MQSRSVSQVLPHHASRTRWFPVSPRLHHFGKLLAAWTPGMVFSFLLLGCAGQAAFREGQELLAQNKVEQGLQKFQEAVNQKPGDARYKSTFLQTRDRALQNYLVQAYRMLEKGNFNEADQLFQQALNIDINNERAKAGLRSIISIQRHDQLLKEANALFDKNDIPGAQAKVRTILTENPQHMQALALKQTINEKLASNPVESQLAAVYKKPITIEFRDGTLKQIFDIISRTSGLNFIFDKDVRLDQKTTLLLKNSSIESAVYYTLLSNQLEQQILDSNTVLIYPNTPAKQKDYQEIIVKSFLLTNADAKVVGNSIRSILKTRDVVVDEKLNMIILRDNLETIKQAEKLIAMQDVAEPEVMLEMEILEVQRTDALDLGIKLPDTLSLTTLPISSTGSGVSGQLTLNDLRNISSRTIGASALSSTITAKSTAGNSNLLANPRIRVRNREKAKILIGERVPNITSTTTSSGFVSESINYIEVGLKLEVEPLIHLDNDSAIKVSLEVSNITDTIKSASSTAFRIGTRSANTVLRLKDGETQVLAGLIRDEDRRNANRVPGIGEFPILDRLFGNGTNSTDKTEIILSITPRLIRNVQRPDASTAEFRAGTDSSTRQRPDAPSALPPAPRLPPAVINSNNPGNAGNANNPSNAGNIGNNGTGNTNNPGNTNVDPSTGKPSTTTSTPIESPIGGAVGGAVGGGVSQNNANQSNTKLRFQGQQKVNAGDTFLVQLVLESDQNIASLPISLGFDNRHLQVVGITEGSFLRQGGAQTTFSSRIDPNGQILITSTRTNGAGGNLPDAVANFTFRALTPVTETRVQVLTVAPIVAGGRTLTLPLPDPYLIQISPTTP